MSISGFDIPGYGALVRRSAACSDTAMSYQQHAVHPSYESH